MYQDTYIEYWGEIFVSARIIEFGITFGSRIQRGDGISNVILSLNESPNDLVMHAG